MTLCHARSNIRVLAVDDCPEHLEALAVLLERRGLHVVTAETSSAALSLLVSYRPDVVVLDMVLPDIDGTSLLAQMRKLRPELAAVLVTGYPGDDLRIVAAIASGRCAYLGKPFDFAALTRTIAKLTAAHSGSSAATSFGVALRSHTR
jgi:DNA-binding NtrC family response regulator